MNSGRTQSFFAGRVAERLERARSANSRKASPLLAHVALSPPATAPRMEVDAADAADLAV